MKPTRCPDGFPNAPARRESNHAGRGCARLSAAVGGTQIAPVSLPYAKALGLFFCAQCGAASPLQKINRTTPKMKAPTNTLCAIASFLNKCRPYPGMCMLLFGFHNNAQLASSNL